MKMKLPYRIIAVFLLTSCAISVYLFLKHTPTNETNKESGEGIGRDALPSPSTPLNEDVCVAAHSRISNATYQTLDIMEAVDYTKEKKDELDISLRIPGIRRKPFTDRDNKLEVIIVPFSHNDPGWLKTMDAYFSEQTYHILNNMLVKLRQYKDMTFVWSETVLLKKWWKELKPNQKKEVMGYIREGRLEMLMGGWVVPDEATTHYYSLVDQMMEGHLWLKEHGIQVNNSWSVDPFGYSATMPYLLKRAGINTTFILRIHELTKSYLQQRRSLEFRWKQHWSSSDDQGIFCHVEPYMLYQIKHNCGPNQAECAFFDFRDVIGDYGLMKPIPIKASNIEDRASMLLTQYRKKSQLFKHNVLLVLLGDDFRYDHLIEWDQQYRNYKKLMDYMNKDKSSNVHIRWGTINDYAKTVAQRLKTAPQKLYKNDYFPSLSGDFYTYSDKDYDYWSGYFTSRPFDKILDRQLQGTVHAAEILNTLALWYCMSANKVYFPYRANIQRLTTARQNLALFQHHDAISGTSKPEAITDYETKLVVGLVHSKLAMMAATEFLLTGFTKGDLLFNAFSDVTSRLTFDIDHITKLLPSAKRLLITDKGCNIVIYNPVAQHRKEFVKFIIDTNSVAVEGKSGEAIPCQINPVWRGIISIDNDNFELICFVDLPPLSLQIINVKQSLYQRYQKTEITVHGTREPVNVASETGFKVRKPDKMDRYITLENRHMKAQFSTSTGLLKTVTVKDEIDHTLRTNLLLGWYDPDASGAYLLRPKNEKLHPVIKNRRGVLAVRVVRGKLFSEVHVIPKDQSLRVHKVRLCKVTALQCYRALEIENTVNLHSKSDIAMEIVMQFSTNINNQNIFYTDLNGFQMMKRKTFRKIHLGGNYYPMATMAYVEDKDLRMSLLSSQSQGVAALRPGTLEVMLDRRLMFDDGRGLGEGIYDNKVTTSQFFLLIEPKMSRSFLPKMRTAAPSHPSLYSHTLVQYLTHPSYQFIATDSFKIKESSFLPLNHPFPCDVRLMNLRNLEQGGRGSTGLSTAMLLHRLGYQCDFATPRLHCQTGTGVIKPSAIFKHWKAENLTETTLTMLHEKKILTRNASLQLSPMEIYTYLIEN